MNVTLQNSKGKTPSQMVHDSAAALKAYLAKVPFPLQRLPRTPCALFGVLSHRVLTWYSPPERFIVTILLRKLHFSLQQLR